MEHPGANDMFLTVRDCHKTARTIMGDMGLTQKEEHMVVSDTDGTIKKILPDRRKDKQIYDTTGQTGAIAFLKFAFSKFGAVIRAAHDDKVDLIGQVEGIAAAWDYTKAMAVYETIQSDPVIGPLFNTTFKVNDQAVVAVGQALVQVNDENERAASVAGTLIDEKTGKNKDLWNFHWAGVVLMDGSDYVTLQAVADQQATGLTVNWWYKMYGSGAQSFHSEEKQDSHVGSRPLTLGVTAEAPARPNKVKNPFEK